MLIIHLQNLNLDILWTTKKISLKTPNKNHRKRIPQQKTSSNS